MYLSIVMYLCIVMYSTVSTYIVMGSVYYDVLSVL